MTQTNSRKRMSSPIETPMPAVMVNPLAAMANPPSRAPNCMGKKNKALANRDVNPSMRMLSTNVACTPKMWRKKSSSTLDRMRAKSSQPKAK